MEKLRKIVKYFQSVIILKQNNSKKGHLTFEKGHLIFEWGCVRTPCTPSGTSLLFHRCFSNILLVKPTTWFIHKRNIGRKWVKIHKHNILMKPFETKANYNKV